MPKYDDYDWVIVQSFLFQSNNKTDYARMRSIEAQPNETETDGLCAALFFSDVRIETA